MKLGNLHLLPMRYAMMLGAFTVLTACSSDSAAVVQEPAANAFALVELFTSEGCSSCPPAEEVVNGFMREGRADNKPIYTLTYHVDYWDDIGWKDPFSNPDYTARQRYYAKKMNTGRVYTPQIVVNGSAEFVGSDESRAKTEISSALAEPRKLVLKIEVTSSPSGVKVMYHIDGMIPDAVLHAALVERDVTSDVTSGENEGRKLTHQNLVRQMADVNDPEEDGVLTLATVEGLKPENASVVVWLQDDMSAEVVAATAKDLK